MNMWDKKFSEEGYYYGTEPNVFLKEWGRKIERGNILTIAEGEGRNAVYLAGLNHDVTAWDYSSVAIEKLKGLAKQNGVEVEAFLKDLETVQWPDKKWDTIVNIFGHLPTAVKEKTLAGVKKGLKDGGLFITEVYSTKQLTYGTGGPKDKELLYEPELLLHTFQDWRFIHFFYGEVERYEGEHHHGRCHVIQAVIQKM